MKLVINKCYGGFSLSDYAVKKLGLSSCHEGIDRDDPRLIELIETEGSDAISGSFATLRICELPDNTTDYEIEEYDGAESVVYVVDGKLNWA